MSGRRLLQTGAMAVTMFLLLLFALAFFAERVSSPARAALATLPPNMVWAWERPEDLRWLPDNAGVAYLAATLELESDQIRIRHRAHALQVRPDTVTIPVIHVDASWRNPPALNAEQGKAITELVLKAANGHAVRAVQLDFEVRRSQRAFYKELVTSLRRQLPRHVALSVTALASWCAGDYWISSLPADEIVPMAFRMAQSGPAIRRQLGEQGRFMRARCRDAIGIAVDEQVAGDSPGRHYFFSPEPWQQASWQQLGR